MPRGAKKLLLLALLLIAGPALATPPLPADVTLRVGRAQTFTGRMASGVPLNGTRDYLWNNDGNKTGIGSGVFQGAYATSQRFYGYGGRQNLPAWWIAHYPQCVVYAPDQITPAYTFGQAYPNATAGGSLGAEGIVPFAFWRSDCRSAYETLLIAPYFPNAALSALSADNVTTNIEAAQQTGAYDTSPFTTTAAQASSGASLKLAADSPSFPTCGGSPACQLIASDGNQTIYYIGTPSAPDGTKTVTLSPTPASTIPSGATVYVGQWDGRYVCSATTGSATTTGASSGASSLPVGSITGTIANSYVISVAPPTAPSLPDYYGSVNGSPSGGSIPVSPNLPQAVPSGDHVTAFGLCASGTDATLNSDWIAWITALRAYVNGLRPSISLVLNLSVGNDIADGNGATDGALVGVSDMIYDEAGFAGNDPTRCDQS